MFKPAVLNTRPARGSNAAHAHHENLRVQKKLLVYFAYFFNISLSLMRPASHFEFETPGFNRVE